MSLIQRIARVFQPREKRIAEEKRAMERRLRTGGMSAQAAKAAVSARYRHGSA